MYKNKIACTLLTPIALALLSAPVSAAQKTNIIYYYTILSNKTPAFTNLRIFVGYSLMLIIMKLNNLKYIL